MRIQITEPTLQPDLVRYLRSLEYLAVEEGDGVTVVPINIVSERTADAQLMRDLDAWKSEHPGVDVKVARESSGNDL